MTQVKLKLETTVNQHTVAFESEVNNLESIPLVVDQFFKLVQFAYDIEKEVKE